MPLTARFSAWQQVIYLIMTRNSPKVTVNVTKTRFLCKTKKSSCFCGFSVIESVVDLRERSSAALYERSGITIISIGG